MRRVWPLWPLLLVSLAVSSAASAPVWLAEGVPVCTHGSIQQTPLIASDGTGGAYVAWVDRRNDEADVYLQRVTAEGEIAPGWPPDGLAAGSAAEYQFVSSLAPDGSGGVYLAWADFRDWLTTDADVYAQRILADGTVAPGWPIGGLGVAALAGVQRAPRLAGDGQGGVYIAWDDERSGSSATADVYLQRLTALGEIAPGWPAGGKNLCLAEGAQGAPALVADGQGGVFVAWGDTRGFATTATDVYASRVGPDGALLTGWGANGNPVCTAPGVQGPYSIARDGSGGIYVAWQDLRTAPASDPFDDDHSDVYLHRVSGAGVMDPAWPAQGLAVCAAEGLQQTVRLVADGTGGALLVWEDYRSFTSADVYVQRVGAAGGPAPGWPADGRLASTAAGYQVTPAIAADGEGGAYVAFEHLNVIHQVYAQHLSGNGAPVPGWPAEGSPVAPVPGVQSNASIVADGLGGAIVAWDDTRAGPNQFDIYAHRLGPMGPTPVQVALVIVEAAPGVVRLEWFAADGVGLLATVERRGEATEWQRLGEIRPDGSRRLQYEDRTVRAGERFGYRLAYWSEGGPTYTAETWVEVPALRFALEGLTPNPSSGDPVVRFTLPRAGSATLELFDLGGRRILAREVGGLGAGAHEVRLSPAGRLAAGVYAIRLRQGADVARARAVVMR